MKEHDVMSIELKIKQKSLAAEGRIISAHMRKIVRGTRRANITRKSGENRKDYAQRLMQTDRSPAGFALGEHYAKLSEHKRLVVRREARLTGLARAVLKGMPYERVERTVREGNRLTVDDLERIAAMVRKYGGPSRHNVTPEELDLWLLGVYDFPKAA